MPLRNPEFESFIENHVLARRWSYMAGQWLSYLPILGPPGSRPDEPLSEFIGFTQAAPQVEGQQVALFGDVPGLRQMVFREGLYLLHKALHVLGCAETDASAGFLTWSISEAYHSAFFGAKAILHLLGIAFPTYEPMSKSILIDIFSAGSNQANRKRLEKRKLDPSFISFVRLDYKLEHRHVWTLLSRALRVMQIEAWPAAYLKALRNLDVTTVSKQRNSIHYGNHEWLFDDLYNLLTSEGFGVHPDAIEQKLVYEHESDFSLVLGIIICRLALLLIEDLARQTNKLTDEIKIIRSRLNSNFHPLYILNFG